MNILITGATGFIGSHLVHRLMSLHHRLFISIRPNSDMSRISDTLQTITPIEIDASLTGIQQTFKENHIDGVIHLATYYRKEDTEAEKVIMDKTNIDFPLHLFEIAQKHGSTFFINTGTCFEYEQSDKPIDEDSPIKPFNYYASTKVTFEKKLKQLAQASPMKVLTLKLFFPYGELDNNKLVKLLVEHIIKREIMHVTPGEQLLSYTYVDDIVDAYVRALTHMQTTKLPYDSIHIGGKAIKVVEIVNTLEMLSNTHEFIVRDKAYPPHEIMSMYTKSEKAKHILGWEPQWTLEAGLSKTYNYYLTH